MSAFSAENTVTSFLWRFAERCGAQGVSFVVSIILARLLDPTAFGTVALVTVFNSIFGVFVDCGFGSAIIQKKDADDLDYSSVFFFSLASGFVLYLVMFFLAPLIAKFYNDMNLVSLVRVSSLTLLVSALKCMQITYVSKNMLFKKFFYSTLGGTIAAALLGIIMACSGFGVWALVAQNIVNVFVDTLILWIIVGWRPKRMFSFERLKTLLQYSWKLLASSFIDTTYLRLRDLIIGKMYSPIDLAYYNKGGNLPNIIITNINSSIDSVLFPVMSSEQDDRVRVKNMTSRAIKTSSFLVMPMLMGLAVCAEPLIRILLTGKWIPCVPYLRIFCFSYAFWPIHTANLNAIKAMGRSDYFLKLEIIKKILGIIVIVGTMWYGVMAMAYGLIFTSIASQIINSYPNKELLGYSYLEQLKDMMPQIVLSCIMGGIVYSVTLLGLNDILTLCIQVPLGIIIYIIGSRIAHIEIYDYLKRLIKQLVRR